MFNPWTVQGERQRTIHLSVSLLVHWLGQTVHEPHLHQWTPSAGVSWPSGLAVQNPAGPDSLAMGLILSFGN